MFIISYQYDYSKILHDIYHTLYTIWCNLCSTLGVLLYVLTSQKNFYLLFITTSKTKLPKIGVRVIHLGILF